MSIDIYVTVTGEEEFRPFVHDAATGGTGQARLTVSHADGGAVFFSAVTAPTLLAFLRAAVAAVEALVPAEAEVAG